MRNRVIHFLLGGIALFLVDLFVLGAPSEPIVVLPANREPIVIKQVRLAQMRQNYVDAGTATGDPTAEQEAVLVRKAVNEEVLYREAVVRGLHQRDRSVRYRLIQKMKFVVGHDTELTDDALHARALELDLAKDDAVIRRLLTAKIKLLIKFGTPIPDPDDTELKEFLDRNPGRYTHPAKYSFTHIYVSNDRYGDKAHAEAERLLVQLTEKSRADGESDGFGDLFPWGHRFEERSEQAIERLFGTQFVNGLVDQRTGAWTGPVHSSFGYHLIYADHREAPQLADLGEVRSQVRMALLTEKRAARFEQALEDLRTGYEVQVEPREGGEPVAWAGGEVSP